MFKKLFETIEDRDVTISLDEYQRLLKSDMQLKTIVQMVDKGFSFDTIVDIIKFFDIKK